jgi:chorismate dehydratase
MAEGAVDVALLPIVELARLRDLELVPGLGIVTFGESRSVLLVSRRPAEEIRSVALDRDSRTSNALTQVLFANLWRRKPAFSLGPPSLDDALAGHDAAVRIGDKALFEPLPDGVFVYDLGEMWTHHTGLPFVFAAWAARAGIVDRELYRILHDSHREGMKVVRQIADGYEWKGARHPSIALAYLTEHIRFRVGSTELQAIEEFFRAAHEIGIVERIPEIRPALQRHTGDHETAEEIGRSR